MKSNIPRLALVVALAFALAATLAGWLPPDALAGLGMIPLVGSTSMSEIIQMIEKQGEGLGKWQQRHDAKQTEIELVVTELATKANRPFLGGSNTQASSNSEDKKAFLAWARTGAEFKGMSSGTAPAGGFLVPDEIDSELSKYLRQRSPMRQISRVVQVGGDEFSQPHSTLGTGYAWVGETSSRSETAPPAIAMATVPTREIYAAPYVSQKLLDDNAFHLEEWLTEELGDAFGDGESAAFINGDGVARPRGIFTYATVSTADATRGYDKFQYVPTGGAGAFASSNPSDALISLIYAVKPQYRANAVWLISGEVLEIVRKFKAATTNEYLWQPSNQAGQPATLMGFPVFEDENIPAIGANSLSAAFGDFRRSYTITDRSTSFLRDPFTAKPNVVFYATKRVGGGAGRDTRAVKFLKFATT